MKPSKDQQGRRHGEILERLQRAKSSFIGSWRCTGGGGYVSPSPRGRGQKSKRDKARETGKEKGESEKILEDPLFVKLRESAPVKRDRLSFEVLALGSRREGHSKRKEKDSSIARGKADGQSLKPKSHLDQGDLNYRRESLGNSDSSTASVHTGLQRSHEAKEKAETRLDALQDRHNEIVEVGDNENEDSSSMPSAAGEESRPTSPLVTGNTKDLDFGRNTEVANASEQGRLESLYSPAGSQPTVSSCSEIEKVGMVQNTISSDDSQNLREDRKAKEEKLLLHSVDGLPEEKVLHEVERSELSPHGQCTESEVESSATDEEGQNLVIHYSKTGSNHHEVKALEQKESPVSVLSSALGSGRWADFDSAICVDAPHTPAGDYPAVVSQNGDAENKIELNHPLHDIAGKESESCDLKPGSSESPEQVSNDETEPLKQTLKDTLLDHTSKNLTESIALQEVMEPTVEKREQKLGCNRAGRTGSFDGTDHCKSTSESGREAQNSENIRETVESEGMQDGLSHQTQSADGGPEDHQKIGNSLDTEGFGEPQTGSGISNVAANGFHRKGTDDFYFIADKVLPESTQLHQTTTLETVHGRPPGYRAGHYLSYLVVGVGVVIAVSFLHYRRILW